MKFFKNQVVNVINCFLVIVLLGMFINVSVTTGQASVYNQQKEINGGDFVYLSTQRSKVVEEKEFTQEEPIEVEIEEIKELPKEEQVFVPSSKIEAPMEEVKDQVLETFTGKVSGYGPDCRGCSGFTSSGFDIYSNGIYYSDSEYGKVRVVAGDPKYAFGTIVRMKNTTFSKEPILAIVLDRGGAIGIGRAYDFDLLFESEASTNGVSKNVTFEILRLGF